MMGFYSIIQNEDNMTCYLCGSTQNLDKHHTWHGTANRKLADEDGLVVRLCRNCHDNLHNRSINDRFLMEVGERAWLDYTGLEVGDFIERYGKNVL